MGAYDAVKDALKTVSGGTPITGPTLETGGSEDIGWLSSIRNVLGQTADAVVAAGAAGSVNAHLRAISRDIGQLMAQGYASAVQVTRTADTNAYLANDVLGSSVAAGGAVIQFNGLAPSGGGDIRIMSATFERDAAALISGETTYTLHLYNVTPPSNLGDNAPFDLSAGDRNAYLGFINLGTPVDLGSTLFVAADNINKQVTALSANLFGYLVTVGPYTPASGAIHRIGLHAVRV